MDIPLTVKIFHFVAISCIGILIKHKIYELKCWEYTGKITEGKCLQVHRANKIDGVRG